MEHIYFATSPQFQGLVKIGRTDRDPSERMGELAGYGLEGFEGESTWSATKQHILVVEDNSTAEATLHQFFSDLRVQEDRELFEVTDLDAMVVEAQRLTGGRLLSEIADEKLAETVVEQIAEWGVAIAGAAVGGVPGIVLANKGLEKLRDTDRYKSAKKSSEVFARAGLGMLGEKLDQHAELSDQVRVQANRASEWVKGKLPFTVSLKKNDAREAPPRTDPVKQAQKTSKVGESIILGTFSSLNEARDFAKGNPKLKIQRLELSDQNLWAVYAVTAMK